MKKANLCFLLALLVPTVISAQDEANTKAMSLREFREFLNIQSLPSISVPRGQPVTISEGPTGTLLTIGKAVCLPGWNYCDAGQFGKCCSPNQKCSITIGYIPTCL